MQFVGRQGELEKLRRKLESDRSENILIYGRRRVGKSELIREALKDADGIVIPYVCRKAPFAQNFSGLAQAVTHAFDESYVTFQNLAGLLSYVFHRASQQKVILFIDEYPFLREDDPSVDSEFQIAIDQYQHDTCLKLILCGSYMDTMQKLVESSAPLFGRFSEIMKVQPFDYYDAAKFFPERTNEDRFFL